MISPVSGPTNVSIMWSTGEVEPVDCIYTGTDSIGYHQWEIILRARVTDERYVQAMTVDAMPPNTRLHFTTDVIAQ